MPDISMCAAIFCPKSRQCYRHADSGTKPSEYLQSYSSFTPGEDCIAFWQVSKRVKAEHDWSMP